MGIPHDKSKVRRGALAAILALACWASPARAAGEGDVEAAREHYDVAMKAVADGDYATAAQLFAEADRLAPSDAALESALKAAVLAEDAVLAMTMVARARDRHVEGDLASQVAEAEARFGDRVATLVIACPHGPCEAALDGDDVEPGRHLVRPGAHRVRIEAAGRVTELQVDAAGGTEETVTAEPPPPEPAPPLPPPRAAAPTGETPSTASASGLSPWWFWGAVGLTGALAGGTIASAVDTRARYDDYLDTRGTGADDGRAAQLRTNALFFTTVGLAVGTAALGLFGVDWGGNGPVIAVAPVPGGPSASATLRF